MDFSLILPAFIAGLLTFFAPCTLPLVPGYLAFIGGTSIKQITKGKKHQIVKNALFYVLGFSTIFILLGIFFSFAGLALSQYRILLTKAGAVLIIFFGLYLMHMFDLKIFSFLKKTKRLTFTQGFKPGTAKSSFLLGATFAAGWTPCVGPILGSILLLASTTTTVFSGAILLTVFSLGLGIPFIFLAYFIEKSTKYVRYINKYLPVISIIGGAFLVVIGVMMLTGVIAHWNAYVYDLFRWVNYERLLDYL